MGSDELGEFLRRAESRLLDLTVESQKADWVYCTYITPDSELVTARAYSRLVAATTELAKASTRRHGRTASGTSAPSASGT